MPLPDISHLQFLLLGALIDGERPGRELRETLAEEGHTKSAPAFYQLMARMEDAKLVEGRYEAKDVDGYLVKERVYKATGAGVDAFNSVADFYSRRVTARFGLGGV